MKDKLDQHLDQKLRESYDALQSKAPEGLWERLKEQLPDPMDVLLDQKLKDGYATLPAAKAPQTLWSSILDELPEEPDVLLDQKLKKSYEQQHLAAPPKVWQAVNRQLNIDKTWLRIESALDGRAIWINRLLRSLQLLAAVALLLLLLRTCNREDPRQPLATTQSSKPVTVVTPARTPSVTLPLKEGQDGPSKTGSTPKRAATAALPSASALSTMATPTPFRERETKRTIATMREGAVQMIEAPALAAVPISTTRVQVEAAQERPADAASLKEGVQIPEQAVLPVDFILTEVDQEQPVQAITQKGSEQQAVSTAALAVLTPDPLEAPETGLDVVIIEPEATTLVNPKPKTPKWTVGVFIALNSTAMLNNETRMGFSQNSLTINYFGVAANYGLWGRYQLGPRHALLAEYSINADHRQAYGIYEKARFRVKEWVMKYNRLGLAYQWTFLNNKQLKRLNNQLTAQVGVYGGWLRSARLLYDGKAVYDRIGEYQSFDMGLKLALGHELQLDNIVFCYGIRSDIGLTNIFKGNNQQAANENHTNLLHLGGYISLGYRF